ncbi:MAG TPA: hypothetical protein VGL60_06410, partial [Acidimicrobiales bacterium]
MLALVLPGAVWLVAPAVPAGADALSTVALEGQGWGSGIGMGQWGAVGYALGQDGGLGSEPYGWILSHFYAPATLQTLGDDAAQTVRVDLTEDDGNFLIATAPSGVTVPGVAPGSTGSTAGAVMFQPAAGGAWNVFTSQGCAGSPGGVWTLQGTVSTPTTAAADGTTVQLCLSGGNLSVGGQLEAVETSTGAQRTVNVVGLGQYLDDVVPSESPASWGS